VSAAAGTIHYTLPAVVVGMQYSAERVRLTPMSTSVALVLIARSQHVDVVDLATMKIIQIERSGQIKRSDRLSEVRKGPPSTLY